MVRKALFSLQKHDDLHIWVFISLWGHASRNGLIRISAFVLLHVPSLVQRAIQLYRLKKRTRSMTFTVLRDRAKTTSVRLTEQESTPDREGISAHSLILGATQRTWLFWARFLLPAFRSNHGPTRIPTPSTLRKRVNLISHLHSTRDNNSCRRETPCCHS